MASYRTDIGIHSATAEGLAVSAAVHSVNGTNWMQIDLDHITLTCFADSPEEPVAILVKLRNYIDAALADQIVPAALRDAA